MLARGFRASRFAGIIRDIPKESGHAKLLATGLSDPAYMCQGADDSSLNGKTYAMFSVHQNPTVFFVSHPMWHCVGIMPGE